MDGLRHYPHNQSRILGGRRQIDGGPLWSPGRMTGGGKSWAMRTGVLVALVLAALVLVGLVVVYLDVMHVVRDWADLHDGPVTD